MTEIAPDRPWAADGIWPGFRRTFREPRDIGLALTMGIFLLMIPRRIDRQPLGEVLRKLENSKPVSPADPIGGVERISRMRQAWLASPLLSARNTCYVRAITLYRFLDPAGRVKRVHFGVEPGTTAVERLRGHAWVTLDGELLEAPEPVIAGRVRELYAYPPHV